ncbi:hypothetical protein GCM10029978_066920 [Actinoallomurus acanthiterrae]
MAQSDAAESYLAKLRTLTERIEASQYPLHDDDLLSADEMADLALHITSAVTLLDATLTLGYAPLPRDWQAAASDP